MLDLPGDLYTQLREAIIATFQSENELQEFLENSYGLKDGTSTYFRLRGDNLPEKVNSLIRRFLANTAKFALFVEKLCGCSEELAVVGARLHVGARAGMLRDDGLPPERGEEALIIASLPITEIGEWRAKFDRAERAVARFESARNVATGFLVARNLILTNLHVVRHLLPVNPADAADAAARVKDVWIRFAAQGAYDFLKRPPANNGEPYKLAEAWLVDSGEGKFPGPVASNQDPGLDWALIRLERDVANRQPVARATTRQVQEGESLLILQHPMGSSLQIALGPQRARHETWFEHAVTTQAGSSGSPCFDSSLELVGVHLGVAGNNLAVLGCAIEALSS